MLRGHDKERGAVRPLWLGLGVLSCVLSGSLVTKCLCSAEDPRQAARAASAGAVVQGEFIDQAPPAPAQPDPAPATGPKVEPGTETKTEPVAEDPKPKDDPELETVERVKLPPLIERPAEEGTPIKKGFTELTFETLANWTYEFPEIVEGKDVRPDPTPLSIKKLNGKQFAIRGFMIPFKVDGEEVTEFLLVRNQFACCFGVVPKMNEWLHVKMAQGKKAPYAVDIPITVYGKFEASELIEKGVVMSLYRMESTEVQEPPVFR